MSIFKESKWAPVFVVHWWGTSILLILLRLYSAITISIKHFVSVGDTFATATVGIANDLVVGLYLAVAFTPLLLLLVWITPKKTVFWYLPSYLFVASWCLGLELYFADELTPLGADFWLYSGNDIATTVAASVQLSTSLIAGIFILTGSLAFVIFFSLSVLRNYKKQFSWAAIALGCFSLLMSLFAPPFSSLQNQYLAASRIGYFLKQSIMAADLFGGSGSIRPEEYPFQKPFDVPDVLGDHFKKFDKPPSIIFIQVEGLGGQLVGNEASMRGFTPFLDSLTTKSLFWTNCLSTTGRTFGVVPALYGSLPFGSSGFMDLGPDYPSHFTLISWLKDFGYQTSYFYGGNINFDKTDIFLEYQGIDRLVYEGVFPASYQRMESNSEGFSWGYPDKALFDFYEKSIANDEGPRLDMLMTLTTHEPFKVPEPKVYAAKFDSVVSKKENKDFYQKYRNIFETFLYFDDALRVLVDKLSERADWENTILVITGDHRVIPLPQEGPLDRFHVPLIIYSPALLESKTYYEVASHAQVAPSLVSYLKSNFGFATKDKLSFISSALPGATAPDAGLSIPLMRNKGDLNIFLDKDTLLASGQLYQVTDGLKTIAVDNPGKKERLEEKLWSFKKRQNVALRNNRLWQYDAQKKIIGFAISDTAMQWLEKNGVKQIGSDSQLYLAKSLAEKKEYEKARWVAGFLLKNSPNYSDARILIGRSFAWEGKYQLAAPILKEVQRRSPNYEDVYLALADVYLWKGQPDSSLIWAQEGKKRFPESAFLDEKIKRLEALE